jgi:hypothetical protein
MPVTYWNPAPLIGAAQGAFKASALAAQQYAKSTAPTHKAGAKVRVVSNSNAFLMPTGLGWVFEQGRQAGYSILPGGATGTRRSYSRSSGATYKVRSKRGGSGSALKFTRGDGGFAASATGGAMAAEPYIRPAGVWWQTIGYRSVAIGRLAAAGFRPR